MTDKVLNKCHYLSLDPGTNTGWATFDDLGNMLMWGTTHSKEPLYKVLDDYNPRVVVMEDFELFPWKAKEQSWSPFDTVRIIGAVEHWCWQHNVDLIQQRPNIKSIGYMWAGLQPPDSKNSMRHQIDAFVHGYYYLQKQGIRKPQQTGTITRA